jgi:predicted nucleic-acid-binding Zn-ribbon protein
MIGTQNPETVRICRTCGCTDIKETRTFSTKQDEDFVDEVCKNCKGTDIWDTEVDEGGFVRCPKCGIKYRPGEGHYHLQPIKGAK